MHSSSRWYALAVKHQHERSIEAALTHKGLEALAAFYSAHRRWSDREKKLERPLFPGYVFCRFELFERVTVLDTPCISRIVGFGGQPAPVGDDEISAIRAAIRSKLPLRAWPHLKLGDRVLIEKGPLKGIEGTLIREKGTLQLIIGIELLQRFIAVEVDSTAVLPASSPLRPAAFAAAAR